MAEATLQQVFQETADAIRAKTGGVLPIYPKDMGEQVNSIRSISYTKMVTINKTLYTADFPDDRKSVDFTVTGGSIDGFYALPIIIAYLAGTSISDKFDPAVLKSTLLTWVLVNNPFTRDGFTSSMYYASLPNDPTDTIRIVSGMADRFFIIPKKEGSTAVIHPVNSVADMSEFKVVVSSGSIDVHTVLLPDSSTGPKYHSSGTFMLMCAAYESLDTLMGDVTWT